MFRCSAADIEGLVVARLVDLIRIHVADRTSSGELNAVSVELIEARAQDAIEVLASPGSTARGRVLDLIRCIEVAQRELRFEVNLSSIDPEADVLTSSIAIDTVRSGKTLKLILPHGGAGDDRQVSASLSKLVAQAFEAREAVGRGGAFKDVAATLGYGPEYLADMIRTSYLSPQIISAIIDAREPRDLSRRKLVQTNRIPLCWREQEQLFGIV